MKAFSHPLMLLNETLAKMPLEPRPDIIEVPPNEVPPTEVPPTEVLPTEVPPTEVPPTEDGANEY